ncbi:MAG: hypothetical protein LBL23_02760, partial [Coriobacteriales bacterium]|nr:hypothetical protein [Coriobacteriales bacterium]
MSDDFAPFAPPPPQGAPVLESAAAVPPPSGAPVLDAVPPAPPGPTGDPVLSAAPLPPPGPTGEAILSAVPPPGPVVEPILPPSPSPTPSPTPTPTPPPPSAPPPPPQAAPPPFAAAPAPVTRRSRKPLLITLIVLALILLCVAGFFVFQEVSRAQAYDEAAAAFEAGDYGVARSGFSDLGEYRDAEERAQTSNTHALYEDAKALYEEGSFEDARTAFSGLLSSDIPDVSEWIDRCDYALADELFTEGDLEDAYRAFLALGNYSDAADRAAGCTQPFPATGVLFQAEGTYSEQCPLDIVYNYSEGGAYYKIYRDDVLVATLFLNANATQRVNLQPGSYIMKEGTGEIWFGEALAFGKQGNYSVLTFDDAGNEFLVLEDGYIMT